MPNLCPRRKCLVSSTVFSEKPYNSLLIAFCSNFKCNRALKILRPNVRSSVLKQPLDDFVITPRHGIVQRESRTRFRTSFEDQLNQTEISAPYCVSEQW